MHTIYRLESSIDGCGPYNYSDERNAELNKAAEKLCKEHANRKHPSIFGDIDEPEEIAWVKANHKDNWTQGVCGFWAKEDIVKWFTSKQLNELEQAKYVVKTYKVDEKAILMGHSHKQVMFFKPKKEEKVQTIDELLKSIA